MTSSIPRSSNKTSRSLARRSLHTRSGLGCAELASSCLILMVVAFLCLNISVAILASCNNERACRDAARAAAQADNFTDAIKMAQTAVAAYPGDGYFISTPVVEVPQSHYEDYYGESPTPDQLPYVCITTKMTVRFPAPIIFFSAKMGNDGTMTFYRQCTFPIVKTKLYL